MNRAASALCATILIAAAAYYPLRVIRPGAELGYGIGAYDIYAYFYPNIRYALDSLARGNGLLWNPYQDCGQPFFAISITGLFYPVNWVFALLPREAALLTSMFLNLAIAGVGAWWLGREMGLSRPAALAGALAFAYSGSALYLASWSPMHIGPYAWMPVALAALERLLRAPSPRHGVLLGLVLTLQLLPGFPQVSVFTYEVIALRVAWELATTRAPRPGALLAAVGLGLAVPPLLAAGQFLPALDVARDSVRSLPLQRAEVGTGVGLSEVRASLGQGLFLQGALTLTALAVAGLGLTRRATRRLAILYLLVAAAAVLLALGDATPAWRLYQRLPGGGAFRGPERFLWITSFALAMACGLGVEAALRRGGGWRGRAGAALALGAGVAVFAILPPHTIVRAEWELLAVVVAAGVAAACWHRLAAAAGLAIGVALAANTLQIGGPFLNHRLGDIYGGKAGVLEQVRARLTAPAGDIGRTDEVLIAELLKLEGAMERNYAWAYELIAPWLGRALLEVGSGVGVVSRFLVERGDPIILSDHHPAYLAHLRARFAARPHVAFQLLDLTRHPYETARPIDTVVCLNVLEHLADDAAVLAGFHRLLPPGGRLVLQVPNYPALYGSLDRTYGHFRRYSRRTIAARVTAAGFRVVALRNFNPLAIPGWVLSAKVLRSRRLNVHAARLFNAVVPIARRLDFLARLGGLALLVAAERPA